MIRGLAEVMNGTVKIIGTLLLFGFHFIPKITVILLHILSGVASGGSGGGNCSSSGGGGGGSSSSSSRWSGSGGSGSSGGGSSSGGSGGRTETRGHTHTFFLSAGRPGGGFFGVFLLRV